MPKRGGRSSRGGRGGARGGARGGRFPNMSKSAKRRANKSGPRDDPEFMDLAAGEYTPQVNTSGNGLPKRPHSMMDEARRTGENKRGLMSRPLRFQAIEFVKAADVYDPSKDLVHQLQDYNKDKLSQDMESLQVSVEVTESEKEPEKESEEPETVQTQVATEDLAPDADGLEDKESVKTEVETIEIVDEVTDSLNVSADGAELDEIVGDEVESDEIESPQAESPQMESPIERPETEEEVEGEQLDNQELEASEDQVMSDIVESVTEEIVEEPDADLDTTQLNPSEEPQIDTIEVYSESASEPDSFVIDDTPDADIIAKHNVRKATTSDVLMQQSFNAPIRRNPNQPAPPLEYDPYVTVGGVMMRTTTDKLGNTVAALPHLSQLANVTTEGFEDLDYSGEYHEESSDEDAAFEDYMEHITVGSEDDMQQDDSVYVISDDDFDVASDDDFDDLDVQYLNSDEEGLEDILSFARNQQKSFTDLDFAPTKTHKVAGKGKKQRLELGSELELELRESLMEQFQYQKKSKRDKKLRKKEKQKQAALELHDLRAKFDYMLHIQEIKQEFESLLHDASRETMSFPPLDGHGNKTIAKLAGHYNMQSTRAGGNGLNLYMKVSKTKKTFRYVPAYDQINYIMRQRPVFKRVDVKPRTKEEIAASDGKKGKKDKAPKNNAFVREGDIVGGAAPEIADSNIGRKLLEKLGWVKGEGLGVQGNKGISVPLTATVKKGKTGLK